MTTDTMTTAVSDTAKNATRRGRPYCGEREALTVRLPAREAEELRRQAEARCVTLNQVATEVMRAGLARW